MINKIGNTISTIFKIIITLVLLYLSFLMLDDNSLFSITFDSSSYTMLNRIFLLSFISSFIIMIWKFKIKKDRSIFLPLTIILLLCTIGLNIYYDNYSMKIDPLLYLHKKYNIKISEMKIIKSEKYYGGDWFGHGGHNRNAIIRYKKYSIYVYYYDNKWNDDYEKQVSFVKEDKLIKEELNTIMKEYTREYKIITDPEVEPREDIYRSMYNEDPIKFSYIIYLYSTNENEIDKIIKKIDNYSNNHPEKPFYSLYIVKDKTIFNKLTSIQFTREKDYYSDDVHTYIDEILEKIGYDCNRIVESQYFDKNIFINNGDETNTKNTNYQKYEYLIFEYDRYGLTLYGIFPNNN